MDGGAPVATWQVEASDGLETAWTRVSGEILVAHGRVVGTRPEPYWLSYELETGPRFVTRRMAVTARTTAGVRRLDLRRAKDGEWDANGQPLSWLSGAEDCDLGLSPLTNSMPVLRYALHRESGERRLMTAWISVPDLTVTATWRTYTHLSRTADGGGLVRYASGNFSADLDFDADGLVTRYPGLAHRWTAPDGQTPTAGDPP